MMATNVKRKIYHEFLWLLADVIGDINLFYYRMAFSEKLASLETMWRPALVKTKELEDVVKKEMSEDKIALTETSKAYTVALAFFEAYLYFFYSLLQIIAKCTPYFYGENRSKIKDCHFGCQRNFFANEAPDLDPELTKYLKDNLA